MKSIEIWCHKYRFKLIIKIKYWFSTLQGQFPSGGTKIILSLVSFHTSPFLASLKNKSCADETILLILYRFILAIKFIIMAINYDIIKCYPFRYSYNVQRAKHQNIVYTMCYFVHQSKLIDL